MPSGNLTMQQMVARQVDMGTYAGPVVHSSATTRAGWSPSRRSRTSARPRRWCAQGPRHHQGRPNSRARRSPTRPAPRSATSSWTSVGPKNGLKKGDFQEVRMDVNNMIAAMAAKTVDAMVNIEPYNAIAEAEGIGTSIMDFFERRPHAGVHGGDARFRREESGRRRGLSEGLARGGGRFQEQPEQGRRK